MQPTRSGIPTTYRRTNFRSRLEARWASLFDLVGWTWIYEPLDAEGYIPDFLIQGPRPLYIEVGPCVTKADYQSKSAKADRVADELAHDVLIVGVSPSMEAGSLSAGWLGEFELGTGPCDAADVHDCSAHAAGVLTWGLGDWHLCRQCRKLAVHHQDMSWVSRPCGHWDGGRYLGVVPAGEIEAMWRQAGNTVQWKAA